MKRANSLNGSSHVWRGKNENKKKRQAGEQGAETIDGYCQNTPAKPACQALKNQTDPSATVKFTLVTKSSGPLTKIIRCKDGKPVKDLSECWLSEGTSQEVTTSLKGFAESLRSCKPNQALIHGISGHKEVKIVSERNFKGQYGTITRTKKFFKYPRKNALTLFDYDVKPGIEPLSHETWLKTMSSAVPGFEQAGYVVTPSTSACIYDKDGHQLTGEGYGFHHYCIVLDPADIPRFNDVLFKRLWLAGYGYIFVSRSGAQLERTIYDQFVMSPERLDFVAGAMCRDGLEQRLPDLVYVEGGVLDTTLLPSLSKSEEAEFKHLVEQAKQDTRDEADTVRAEYVKTEAPKLAKRANVSQNEARKILSTRVCGKLDAEDFLEFDNGEPARAGDILKNPARYHLKTLRDPLEPEQGKCKAKLFLNNDGSVIVNSYLHGGRTWRLQEDSKVQSELLLEETRRDPGAPYRPENLNMLAAMKNRDLPSFIALREKLKSLKVGVTRLDQAIDAKAGDNSEITANNHLQIARKVASFYGHKNILSTEAFIWKWDESGVWRKIDDREIKYEIHKAINSGKISKSIVESILDLLKTEIFIPGHSFDINTTAINCLNGELHWNGQTWDLQPHKRENYRTAQIPVAYDPEARAPRFERFLEEVFSGDADKDKKIYLVCEAFGYSLLYSTKYEKFFILVGPGANGKSVLMNTLSCLVGPEYVAAVQPCQLENRFQRAHLHCKLVNLVTEVAEGHMIADAQLKAIVSGELTTAEHKSFCLFLGLSKNTSRTGV
jgi:hypothetical protein